jgi:hypothetical protein
MNANLALLSFAALSLAASVAAQTPAHLVGLTAQIPTVTHRDQSTCTTLSQCTPAGFPATVGLPYLGGTGWDPILSGAWISNGPVIACVSDTCGYLCPPGPSPTPSPITGLEVVESLNQIWATDALGNVCRMTRSCPPALINVCNTGAPVSPTQGLSGLAVDEGRGLVFMSHGNWGTGATTILVSTMTSPCTPFFTMTLPAVCSNFRIATGLAVDWGNTVLYVTDGFTTIKLPYVASPGPTIAFLPPGPCCMLLNGGDTFVGLAWRPSPAVPFGTPCAAAPCPSCPMVHGTNGDSNLGNGSFALTLNGVPAGSLAWCLLTVGSCSAPGTSIAALCGPLWTTSASLGTLGPNLVPGSGCSNTQFPLPLPPVPAFAGLPLASQCIAVCPSFGITMSNCLSWVLQGN